MKRQILNLGCTAFRHKQIGIHAVINARAGRQDLNNRSDEEIEMRRDAEKIRQKLESRIRFYQFNSKAFRKAPQVQHLLSSYDD